MVVKSCDDKNKFLSVCVSIASRIHIFFICEAFASGKKWFQSVAFEDLEFFWFHRGDPKKGATSDAWFSSIARRVRNSAKGSDGSPFAGVPRW